MEILKWFERNHEKVGNHPKLWKIQGEELIMGAKLLYDNIPDLKSLTNQNEDKIVFVSLSLMLYGMAVECLLKGLWLQMSDNNKLVSDKKYRGVNGIKDNHDLLKLYPIIKKHYGIDFSFDDLRLLDILSSKIITGRYPIKKHPMTSDQIEKMRTGESGIHFNSDFVNIDQLMKKIIEKYSV
ncbi:MAG TPA: hypothetical protein PLE16_04170 [Spirochaetota bacterium]|jgi:hypothetical protein|nr:hypothetical protein [Bacilli bacterium]HOH62379.1 hypothetical protein [Bacilli bacterium]HPJ14124.1 hypothetical protein [Spirochaetota bacterium]HPM33779.1 hypothetical protein [Spirochaetota bacterium]